MQRQPAGFPAAHQKAAQGEHLLRPAPVAQVKERILPDEVVQLRTRHLLLQPGQRIHRIGYAFAVNFHARGGKSRYAAHCKTSHFIPVFRVRQPVMLVRRISGRQENHAIQLLFPLCAGGDFDMPVMDGIEAPAHDADALLWHGCASLQSETLRTHYTGKTHR